MIRKRVLCLSFMIIVLLLLVPAFSFIIVVNSPNAYAQATGSSSRNNTKKGAFIDQVNFVHYLDENLAIQDLKAGKIDTYFFNIPPSLVSDVKNNPNLNAYESIGFNDDLLLNPASPKSPVTTGDFNPFSIRQVRFAMNYLIDRDFIVNEILKGYGVPMIDPYGVYSPEYLNIIDTVQSFGFRHDPIMAEKMISDALLHAGATKDSSSTSGKWVYNGKPVTISILIRSDIPVSKSIGETVASDLENTGFNVVRDYGDRDKANSLVYGSDPQDLKWNIYTESGSGMTFLKYSPADVALSYAPWNANMPGVQNPSYWNYKNSTLDIITKKLVFGNFGSENERNNLLRNAVKDGIQESVRVYIATLTPTYIATNNVKGLVNDFAAGITNRLSLVNSRLEDNRTDMNVGAKQINVGAWNNIAGFKDIYSTEIINGIQDPATFNHPYTGETIPFRTPWIDIQIDGPHAAISVAPDVIIWDPVGQHWKKVTTATSKVTFNLLYGKWHNGIMMDKNDVLYTNYFQHEWGTNTGPTDKKVDSEYTSRAAASLKFDQGIRFLSDNKLESYTNFWHFDKSEIAGFATWWPVEPWEITAAEERLVTEGKFAFSKTDSTSKGIDWLSLLVPSHANAIKEELIKMKAEGYVPIALRDTVSVDEASKRYAASINWITQHSNAIIGNGPFYLDRYNPSAGVITIKAFRDNSYPFNVGYWNKYEHPRLATISNVATDISRTLHIGQPSNMVIHVNVDGKPSNNATVHYYLSNTDGKVIASGIAKPFPPLSSRSSSTTSTIGKFSIALSGSDTQKLSPGPNTLKLFAVSFDAYKPDIVTKTIIAVKNM
jgi:peptide/nickel transport system substrate-binding protein